MAGLKRLAKLYGAIVINGQRFVYDYAQDKAIPEKEMPNGSERHALSEKAKYLKHPPRNALICAARGCDGCNICQPENKHRKDA